jgi:predicted Rossmann-fold nucleotide-binding protein
VLSPGGYFEPLRELLEHSVRSGFLRKTDLELVKIEDDAERLIDDLRARL